MRRTPTLAIEALLAGIAKDQFGLITSAQAAQQGIHGDSLEERMKRKTLFRLYRGVYRIASERPSESQNSLASWLAISKPNVSIARRSAARIHGLPIGSQPQSSNELLCFGNDRVRIKEVTNTAGGFGGVLRTGVTMRTTTTKPQTQGWHGARITNASQTICDLAIDLDRDTLARCIDHAIAHGISTATSIRKIVDAKAVARFTGRAMLVELLDDRHDGRLKHRSMLEQRTGKWLTEAGLGGFVPNYLIAEADDLEVDFAWINSYVGLEVSPFFTHSSEKKQRRDNERRHILLPTRWNVVEVTDSDLESPKAFAPTIALLKELIAGVGPQPCSPPDQVPSRTRSRNGFLTQHGSAR